MHSKQTRRLAALVVLGLAGQAQADEGAGPAPKTGTPLSVQVVFSRYQGEKKVSNMPYTLSVNAADDENAAQRARASLRVGIQVPVMASTGEDKSPTVVYKDVGTNLDCTVQALGGGRYKLTFSLEQGSVYASDPVAKGPTELAAFHAPVLRNFRSQASLILRDGQTAQYVAAADPISGEMLKIDVTLNVLK